MHTLSRLPWPLAPRKQRPSIVEPPQPLTFIAQAFHDFIRNDIPARLVDTSRLTFVERDAVFDVFSAEIAQITEEDVHRRMCTLSVDTNPEAGIYIKQRKVAIRETIRDVARYAIFSHRWTDNEPSYQDVSAIASSGSFGKQRNFKTAGLAKLVQLCETARLLGYKLVWTDTCCIDKANHVELSEAIHAMYRWYANAHVCIVHLGASLSFADFDQEPWFKRGWTLQELLAPRRIKFYGQTWRPFTDLLNDKDDPALMAALSRVTRIPPDVVVADNSRGIKGHGIWKIMSWASTRETTRIEDNAYCLYGLFDINIPITYGEGEKAFPRLIEALAARYQAWDVFAWEGQAYERHPALPCSPACYPRWDEGMVSGGVGMTEFTLTAHGLRLMSVPLIPMAFASEEKGESGSYTVSLRPKPEAAGLVGMWSNMNVICGAGRLEHIRAATDLHACILNYKPSQKHRDQRKLQAGRAYVCFLLHMEGPSAEGTSWLKFATDNMLRIVFQGMPVEETGPFKAEDRMIDPPLEATYVRAPRAQSTFCWT